MYSRPTVKGLVTTELTLTDGISVPKFGGDGLRAGSWQCPSGEELLAIGGVEDEGGELAKSPVDRIIATGRAIGGGGGGGNIELG